MALLLANFTLAGALRFLDFLWPFEDAIRNAASGSHSTMSLRTSGAWGAAVVIGACSLLLLLRTEGETSPRSQPTSGDEKIAAEQTRIQPESLFATAANDTAAQDSASVPDFAEEIRRALELKSSGERARALDKLLHEWVIRDAPAAARFVMELGSQHPLREDVIRCLVKFWALHDTPAVMAWASQLPDPSERKFALSQACMQMSERAPRSAIQEAIKYQLHEADNGLLENLTAQWATEDIPAAFDWVNQLPPGDLRDKLVLHIALVCSKIDPAEAARLVLNQIPPGGNQNEAIISVVYQWAVQDKEEANAWVQLFPEGSLRQRAMNEITTIVSYKQPGSSL